MDKIGDGECDYENLVGFCSFDGYDCCNVTESNKTHIGKIIDIGSGYSSGLNKHVYTSIYSYKKIQPHAFFHLIRFSHQHAFSPIKG